MIGKFITIEGIDGSGKTTMIGFLKEYLENKGFDVVVTREPGGVSVSEKIRDILLFDEIDKKTEVLLFAASRREHIKNKILPELKKNKIVICDRFLDSSISYQSYGRGLNKEDVLAINNYILEGLSPDATFYFSIDVETSLKRVGNRGESNKMDNEKYNFYHNVKKGYDEISIEDKDRVIVIDASKSLEEVKNEFLILVERLLEKWQKIV